MQQFCPRGAVVDSASLSKQEISSLGRRQLDSACVDQILSRACYMRENGDDKACVSPVYSLASPRTSHYDISCKRVDVC